MKVFVLALMLLVLTAGLIGWGSWYIHRICGELLMILEEMDMEIGELGVYGEYHSRFERKLGKGKKMLQVILGREVVEKVEDMFGKMGSCYVGEDDLGYAWEREMLMRYLKRLVKEEEITVDSILCRTS